jgi:hypothetical protein
MAEPGTSVVLNPVAAPGGPFCNTVWLDAEYLLWFIKGNQLPPLLTQGATADTIPGGLGQPGTSVLYGGNDDSGVRSGGRVRGGIWFGNDHVFGVDGSFFFLGRTTKTYTTGSSGNPVLAVPYFDVTADQQGALQLAYPGLTSAAYTAALQNRLLGADTNFRTAVWRSNCVQFTLLAGFRYLLLDEALETTTDTKLAGESLETVAASHFTTTNNFYGGQVGAETSLFYRGFILDLTAKVALGLTHESAGIDGSTLVTSPAGRVVYPFGGLAQSTNSGTYTRNVFTWVPEVGANLAYQFTSHIRALVGYTFLYTSRAVRPGNLIDTGVNPTVVAHDLAGTPITGQPRPTFPGLDSTFWAQGVNVGLEFRY